MTSLLAQPWFAISQTMFVVAAWGMGTIGFINGEVSGPLQILAVIAIPAITMAFAGRIYRRLRAVRHERPVDASEDLLAEALWGMECTAMLALLALVVGSMSN